MEFFRKKRIFNKDPNLRPSSNDLLREPYIENHIKNMIKRLSSLAAVINENEDEAAVKSAAADISKVMNAKYYVKDLKTATKSVETPKKTQSDDRDSEKTLKAQSNDAELTPKERLLLNKLKKADEEARRVSVMAKENYEERLLRESVRREATFSAVRLCFMELYFLGEIFKIFFILAFEK